jgi:hypothetical protein
MTAPRRRRGVPPKSVLALRAQGRSLERAIARTMGREREQLALGLPSDAGPRARRSSARRLARPTPTRSSSQLALRMPATCSECGRRNYHLRSCSRRR